MSNALAGTSQSAGSGFAQQGSVDWVSLSNSTLNFSVDTLARFSRAGVEILTVTVGQAIFSELWVPPEGQKRLTDAIAKLKAFSSYSDALWFGFGIKHIVRVLCETEQGASCTAICACLSVSYDPLFASQVLKALTDQYLAPGALKPALSQWGALLNVCAGIVGGSQFPLLVEGFSRVMKGPTFRGDVRYLHTATSAKMLAGALQELFNVSNRRTRSITFEGGVDCAWIAAVAQWLFCLSIKILDDKGECVYSNN
jgi:hypothetical protein